jgi:MFS family permease
MASGSVVPATGEFSAASISAAVGAGVGILFGPTSVTVIPLGLFMVEMSKEFGWHRTTFFLITMLSAWTAAIVAPVAGRAIDRWGVRRIVVPGALLYGAATAAMALVEPSVWKVVPLFVLVGIMAGVQSPIGFSKIVASWFNRWRALMLAAITAVGGGVGAAASPFFVHHMIGAYGWRSAYIALGVAVMVLATPLLFLLVRMPRGVETRDVAVRRHQAAAAASDRRAALRTPTFWFILVATFLSVGPMTAIMAHCFALVTDKGIAPETATTVLALIGAGGMVGQLASGYFFDRFQTPMVALPTFAIGLLGFILIHLGGTAPMLLVAGALIGIGRGAEGVVPAYFATRYFGLAAFGQIFGLIYGALVIAAGLGPVLMGIAFDMSGSYRAMLVGSECAFVVCILLVARLGPYEFPADGRRPSLLEGEALLTPVRVGSVAE